jgi:hypothetical protein
VFGTVPHAGFFFVKKVAREDFVVQSFIHRKKKKEEQISMCYAKARFCLHVRACLVGGWASHLAAWWHTVESGW